MAGGGSLGELVLKFTADIADILSATQRMDRELNSFVENANRQLKGLGDAMKMVGQAFAVAGLGGAVGEFGKMVAETIHAEAELQRMAERAGTTAEALDSMRLAAEDSGASMDTIASMSARLSKNLYEAQEGSSKAAQALEQLHLNAADLIKLPTDQAMLAVARALSQVENGSTRTALMMEILGRNSQTAGAFMKSLATVGTEAAAVTNEQAAAAKTLELEFARLNDAWREQKLRIANDVIPALDLYARTLNGLLGTVREVSRITIDLGSSHTTLGNTLATVVSPYGLLLNLVRSGIVAYQDITRATEAWDHATHAADIGIRDLTADLPQLEELMKRVAVIMNQIQAREIGISPQFVKQVEDLSAAYNAGKLTLQEYNTAVTKLVQQQPVVVSANERAAASAKALQADQERLKQANIDLVNSFVDIQNTIGKSAYAIEQYRIRTSTMTAEQKKFALEVARQNEVARLAMEDLDDEIRKSADDWKAYGEAITPNTKVMDDFAKSLEEQNRTLEINIATMGMSTIEAQKWVIQQQLADPAIRANSRAVEALTRQLNLLNEAEGKAGILKLAEDSTRAWQRAANDIGNALDRAFMDVFEHGKSMAESFREFLKSMFNTLVLRPILQFAATGITSFLQSLTGAGGGAGAAGGFNAGNALNLFSLGGGSIFDFLGLSGTPFAAAAGAGFSAGWATLNIALSAGAEAVGGFGAVLGAAIPAIGPIIAIGSLIAGALGLFDKEPSQVRGTFGIRAPGTSPSEFEDQAFTESKFGAIGFLDQGTQYFSGQAAQAFNKIVGGALEVFAKRMSPEQQSKLSDILQTTAFPSFEGTYTTEDFISKYGGQVLKQVVTAAFSVLDPALASVASRFTGTAEEIVAFTNSLLVFHDVTKGLPDEVKDNLTSALGSTQSSVDNITRIAVAAGTIFSLDKVDLASAASEVYATSLQTQYESLTKQGDALSDLILKTDTSAESSEKLAKATAEYATAAVTLLAQIKAIASAMHTMFSDTADMIRQSTMTNEQKYADYQRQISEQMKIVNTSDDPFKVEQAGKRINQLIGQSWNLLSPEQQRAMQPGFLSMITDPVTGVDAVVRRRLEKIGATVATTAEGKIDDAATKMTNVAESLSKSAEKQSTAADTQLTAARTPKTININLTGTASEVGNLG